MDKKGIIGVAICAALLLLWGPLMQYLGWAPPRAPADVRRKAPQPAAGAEARTGKPKKTASSLESRPPSERAAVAGKGRQAQAEHSASEKPGAQAPARTAAKRRSASRGGGGLEPCAPPEATVSIGDPDTVRLELDKARGGVVSATLSRFERDKGRGKYVLGDFRFPSCRLVCVDSQADLEPGTVRVLSPDRAVLDRRFRKRPLVVHEEWRLEKSASYGLHYTVTFKAAGPSAVDVPECLVLAGGIPLAAGGKAHGAARFTTFPPQVSVLFAGAKRPRSFSIKKVARLKPGVAKILLRQPLRWVAVHSKYFIQCLAAAGKETEIPGMTMAVTPAGAGRPGVLAAAVRIGGDALDPGSRRVTTLRAYLGPKELARLRSWAPALDSVMQLDRFFFFHPAWMGWLSRGILHALIFLDQRFQSRWGYGWAILLVTFAIKMLFWPLTHYSTMSMRKMQKIQPLMKEIREKYKDDPQKMNRKIMELYREHNVSPFGGCLPMLLQIPVFFALFNVLRGAIELRKASFFWVADLSQPDTVFEIFHFPVRPLAILMTGTMFIQQKLTPTSADPSQARMMIFMTIFMAFLFYSMPAGLTLYWTTNQVLTIGQTLVAREIERRREARAAASS